MSSSLSHNELFQPSSTQTEQPRLSVEMAATRADIAAVQRLHHDVFATEMGVRLDSPTRGQDGDRSDRHCEHLLIRDRRDRRVAGCARILTDDGATAIGGYHAQSKFDLTHILAMSGRILELDRVCVHPAYRNGTTLALLWRGVARFLLTHQFDYVIACAGIPLAPNAADAIALYTRLAHEFPSAAGCRVYPKVHLPSPPPTEAHRAMRVPALIRAGLHAGARICGESAWDPRFNTAEVFMLLHTDLITERYMRHFLAR